MNYVTTLKDEFDYYLQHKDSFVNKYEGKFIALKNHTVICEANSREEAIANSVKMNHEIGTFLVQHVSKSDDESIQRYHSRICS